VALAGCSIGGVIGALQAAGYSADEILDMARNLRRRDLVDVGEHGGILGMGRLGKYLESRLPGTFEDLAVPLKVTTVDCQRGSLVVLGAGRLVPALLASAAIPGLLSPVLHEDRVLLDGGVLNNLPVDLIRSMTTRPVVAVDVAVPPDRALNFRDERSLLERLSAAFNPAQRRLTVELFLKSFDIPVRVLTEMQLVLHPPDVLVRPALDPDFKREDFDRLEEAVEAGHRRTHELLEEIENSPDRED
jgi:NTE family protein